MAAEVNCDGVAADGQLASVRVNLSETVLSYRVGTEFDSLFINTVTDTSDMGLNYITSANDIWLETNAAVGSVFHFRDQDIQVSCN